MEVGAPVSVLPLELAGAACEEAGVKWNPARKKRAGGKGTVVSVEGDKIKVKFEDEVKDPNTGELLRTDTATLVFPPKALQSVDAAGEAAAAQMEQAMATASEKLSAAAAQVESLQSEKEAATAALQAEVASLTKGKEQQLLKVQRLQKEMASGMKSVEAATAEAAAAQEGRREALSRAEAAEGAVASLERKLQLVLEAARGGQSTTHHADSGGEASVKAHDTFDVTLEVTDEHIYGSGGASLCYQFDIAAYDVAFGIWLKRTGADVLTHGEEVVLISEKYESVRTTPPPPDLLPC